MSITPLLFHRCRTAAGRGKMAAAKRRRSAAPPALHRRRGSGVSPSRCVDGHGEKSPCFVYMIAGTRSAKRPKNTHNFLRFLQSITHIFPFVHPQLADRFRQGAQQARRRRKLTGFSYTINIQHLLSLVKLLNPRRIHRNVRL